MLHILKAECGVLLPNMVVHAASDQFNEAVESQLHQLQR